MGSSEIFHFRGLLLGIVLYHSYHKIKQLLQGNSSLAQQRNLFTCQFMVSLPAPQCLLMVTEASGGEVDVMHCSSRTWHSLERYLPLSDRQKLWGPQRSHSHGLLLGRVLCNDHHKLKQLLQGDREFHREEGLCQLMV